MGATVQQIIDNYLHEELMRIYRDGPGFNHVINRHLNIQERALKERMVWENPLYQATFVCEDIPSFRVALYNALAEWEDGLAYYVLHGTEPIKLAIDNPFKSYGFKRDRMGGQIERVDKLPYILLCIGKVEGQNLPVVYTAFPVTEDVASLYM